MNFFCGCQQDEAKEKKTMKKRKKNKEKMGKQEINGKEWMDKNKGNGSY